MLLKVTGLEDSLKAIRANGLYGRKYGHPISIVSILIWLLFLNYDFVVKVYDIIDLKVRLLNCILELLRQGLVVITQVHVHFVGLK